MATFAKALRGGTAQLGLAVAYPAPGIIERIGAEWDWLWIDGQHGELGYAEILALVRACDAIDRPAIVRVPGHGPSPIGQALDMGVAGVIVPCVDTPEQAQALVQAAKFPPLGARSYGGRRVIDRFGRSYSDTANADTLLIAQIETPRAIENVEGIAAVPGVDALFLGPDDLLLRRGVRMDVPRTRDMLAADMTAVAAACLRHRKLGVTVAVGPELFGLAMDMGFDLIVAGSDAGFLANASRQASSEARALAAHGANAASGRPS